MGVLSRAIFREVATAAALGTVLFTFVLFLQKLNRLFEVLVRGTATPETVAYLLSLLLPQVLVFSLPIGTLVGVLIGLGRMSADGEITAMRAAGVSARRVVVPVIVFALFATAVAAVCSVRIAPFAIREQYRLVNTAIAQQLTAEVQRGVFEEQFTNSHTILYVGDVSPSAGTVARWKNVFIADLTPPQERKSRGNREYGDAPSITLSSDAVAIPDAATNRLQLSMTGVFTHEIEKDPTKYHDTQTPSQHQILAANPRTAQGPSKAYVALDTLPLAEQARDALDARVEFQKRLALPFACLVLALAGIPLGTSSRKSGKSGAFVLTVFLAFLYYMALISLTGLAEQKRLPVEVALWAPNVAFGLFGIVMMVRLERPGDRDFLSRIRAAWTGVATSLRPKDGPGRLSTVSIPRIPLLPGIVDTYVLSGFLFWTLAWLAGFVLAAHVFIFFDLLGDIFSRGISMGKVAQYHLFLTPKLLYEAAPMAVLAAVLVAFGVLAKNNEIIAMKACGVSLYRMALPVVMAAMTMSGGLFAFDHYYIPQANRIQDGILNEIKGRPAQTYLNPNRKWVFGQPGALNRIYHFKYLDTNQHVMAGAHVFEIDPASFRLVRHIGAASVRWEPAVGQWIFQDGWMFEYDGYRVKRFEQYQVKTFPDLPETPEYFLTEKKQEQQLNFKELEAYIRELRQSGFDTVRMRVQYHRKFSVPMFVWIMALIAVPFSFLTGNRGAMAGVGVSIGIAMAYFAIGRLFAEIGNVNQLAAPVAAWAPDVVFAVAGLYFFTRMRS